MPSRSSRNSNPNYASLAGLAALYAAGSAFNRLNAMHCGITSLVTRLVMSELLVTITSFVMPV
jgi:hypothetical protein